MKKNTSNLIENIFIFLLLLLMLPFPRIVEDILILGTIAVSLFSCLSCRIKHCNIKKIYADNLPYLIISMMLLQIHAVRFSLVAKDFNEQLISVQIVQWITDKFKSSEVIIFCTLIYLWLLLYFMIVFSNIEVNKIVVVNEHFKYETLKLEKIKILQGKETGEDEISVSNLLQKSKYEEDFCSYLSKIQKYLNILYVCRKIFSYGIYNYLHCRCHPRWYNRRSHRYLCYQSNQSCSNLHDDKRCH